MCVCVCMCVCVQLRGMICKVERRLTQRLPCARDRVHCCVIQQHKVYHCTHIHTPSTTRAAHTTHTTHTHTYTHTYTKNIGCAEEVRSLERLRLPSIRSTKAGVSSSVALPPPAPSSDAPAPFSAALAAQEALPLLHACKLTQESINTVVADLGLVLQHATTSFGSCAPPDFKPSAFVK